MALFGDWRDTRAVIEAAYEGIGESHPGNIPRRDWNLVERALEKFKALSGRTCGECGQPIAFRAEIVCLDCGVALHKGCAPRHFWPAGRPDRRD
ncbi:hypothetical protein EYW49_21970 [Siculibacillus lacustris]|uniref:Phorbol-ester/DAG-type domain-containing protein n=1 Tax=Siculibacillus lacustris TaxID=1549641 RepID=A0A4Q9VD82_9HYPH|nr:hypothetical protein [Siculibacillus lacustris]TBW32608.1 hypothetical protein EYW49_21970 [Siculibacillus lacustris]